jgi:hypothetical protein
VCAECKEKWVTLIKQNILINWHLQGLPCIREDGFSTGEGIAGRGAEFAGGKIFLTCHA